MEVVMAQPWKTKKWFVSPWCYLPELTKGFKFPPKIKIHDVTLRDGEQQTGVVFRREEKVEIAKRLDSMGVHRIEAGMPAVSPQDKAAISEIANLGMKAQIFAFARCLVSDIEAAKECGCKGVIVEIPSSDHIIKNAYAWPLERAVKSSIEATLAAKEAGLYTVFFTIDSTRTEVEKLLDKVQHVAEEGHMDAFTIADSFGGCTPEAIHFVVRKSDQAAQEAYGDSLSSGLRAGSSQHHLWPYGRSVGGAHHRDRPGRAGRQRSHGRCCAFTAVPVWNQARHSH